MNEKEGLSVSMVVNIMAEICEKADETGVELYSKPDGTGELEKYVKVSDVEEIVNKYIDFGKRKNKCGSSKKEGNKNGED